MSHCRCAGIVIPALAALNHPARRATCIRSLRWTARTGRLAFRIVTAVAFFAGYRVASETVTVALASNQNKIYR